VSQYPDTLDMTQVGRTIAMRWRLLIASTAIGALLAVAVLLYAPRRFESSSSIVVRSGTDLGGSIASRIGFGDGDGSGLLGGIMKTPIETEIQVLSSRATAQAVVDSLGLQARVLSPAGRPSSALVGAVDLPGSFRPLKLTGTRRPEGSYHLEWRGGAALASPGEAVRLPVGSITLASTDLPDQFTLRLLDREDAVTRTARRLKASKAGGEVVKIVFRADDSTTAAAGANAAVTTYLARRRTTDRGLNERKVEFLTSQIDSVNRALAVAERELRVFQEGTGLIEPEVVGKLQLETTMELRQELGALEVERAALEQLLAQVGSGGLSNRQVATFPSFVKSPAINDMLGQMMRLQTERSILLERRLETDAEVQAIDRSIAQLETSLIPLAESYSAGLARQRHGVRFQLDTLEAQLAAFPQAAEAGVRKQRDVLRLSQIHGALLVQLAEARLGAIGEGGDVRRLDVAVPSKKPAFPAPVPTLLGGIGGGIAVGLFLALLFGTLGRWVEDPYTIERATGVPALQFQDGATLLMAGAPASRTILLIPLEIGADTGGVAAQLAQTALMRSTTATVLDLSGGAEVLEPSAPADTASGVGARIAGLEQEFGFVIVRLPGLMSDATAGAIAATRPVLFVAPPGRVDRPRLVSAVETLKRLEVPCAGVVVGSPRSAAVNGRPGRLARA
jgi:uncharacterized protein involved in exopolysaccharide biosynthesis